ncbi:MAG: amino acid ABC transporter permease [Christensenellales bacterium]
MSAWDVFYKQFITYEGYKEVLNGLKATALIAVLGLFIGIVIGTVIAISKVVPQNNPFVKVWAGISDLYTWFFRGTPMVVQLLIFYFILFPSLGVKVDKLIVAIAAFGLNSGAYVSEIMRSGILSVDKGQMEAARSLGLGYTPSMVSVVLPQAVKNILPTLGNEFITLVKETSVVSFIAVVDLTKAFRSIGDATYEYVIPYLMLAAVYLVLVSLITLLVKAIERRMRKSERR